jgi:hypothetical protein
MCAKVMHLSGAAEVVEKLLQDRRTEDGTNATQLSFALSIAISREVAPQKCAHATIMLNLGCHFCFRQKTGA